MAARSGKNEGAGKLLVDKEVGVGESELLARIAKLKAMAANDPRAKKQLAEMRGRLEGQRAIREAQLLEWSAKKIRAYLRWRMEGKAHELRFPSASAGGKTFDEMSLAEVVSSGFGLPWTLELKDWLEVREWLQEFVALNPEAELLDELLVHHVYYGRPVKELLVPSPFVGSRRQLYTLGPASVNGARAAIDKFDWFVARKIEQEIVRQGAGE
jgi:hypothetical protein